jgi:hypothetical protein
VDIDPLRETRLAAQQPPQLGSQRVCERIGKRCQQNPRVRMGAREMMRPMQSHDGLAGPGGAGHARRAGVVALHPLPLIGVKEDGPLVPGEVEGALQLLHARHDPEAALGIGMIERAANRNSAREYPRLGVGGQERVLNACNRGGQLGHARPAACGKFQQRLPGLRREVASQDQERVVGRVLHVTDPFDGNAVAEEHVVGQLGEEGWLLGLGRLMPLVVGDPDLLHGLAYLDELGCARLRMRFELPPLRPAIGLMVMSHVAEQEARFGLVNDQADVAVDPHGPEILVLCPIKLVKAHAGAGRIELKIECRRFDRLLLFAGQTGEAVGKAIGDQELHCSPVRSPVPSS